MSYLSLISLGLFLAATLAYVVWRWLKTHPREIGFGLPTKTARVGDFEVRYHRSGRGPFLVLIHGIGADLQCWRHLVPRLTDHFTVIALDLPGFGLSSKIPDAGYGLDDQAERLVGFLDVVGVSKAFLVGNSMGGNLALWLAILKEKRVEGVAVIAPPSRILPVSLKKWSWVAKPASYLVARPTLRWLHEMTVTRTELVSHERVEETLKVYARNPNAISSFLSATETLSDGRLKKRLREIEQPVLVLWGSADRLVSRKTIKNLTAALPRVESQVHDGGGHHLQEDEPAWVADKIRTFFKT